MTQQPQNCACVCVYVPRVYVRGHGWMRTCMCKYRSVCILKRVCVREQGGLWGMHHFPGRQIWKCMTTLAWQPCHDPSINQLCNIYMHTESARTHTQTHTQMHTSCECRNMLMECHVIYYPIYSREREKEKWWEIGWGLKKWTWHPTKPVLKSDGAQALAPGAKPFLSSFLFIWSSLVVCRTSHRILLHLWWQIGTGAAILGGWWGRDRDRWIEMVKE